MTEDIIEVESLECVAAITDRDDNELFRMDVVEAQVRLDVIRSRTDDPDKIVQQFGEWLHKKFELEKPPSYGFTWNVMGITGSLFSEFKKKQDSILKSLTTTTSIPSSLVPSND